MNNGINLGRFHTGTKGLWKRILAFPFIWVVGVISYTFGMIDWLITGDGFHMALTPKERDED